MSKFKAGKSREYLKRINQEAVQTDQYYNAIIDEIAHCIKKHGGLAESIVLCDDSPDGNKRYNFFNENGEIIFPVGKYIIVNFPAGYYTESECLGGITISQDLHELLLEEGWKIHQASFEVTYELSLINPWY